MGTQNEAVEIATSQLPKAFETFGSYILLKKLANGGMAEVFLARPASQMGNGRIQVVKRILPHIANNSVFHSMFQDEIQVIMGFNHPHTVQLHDFGEHNTQPFIAMEYIEGKNLKELMNKFLEKNEFMPIPMVLSITAQAASGLSYAHTFVNKVTGEEVNAIHRDISPHNLILSYDGNVKVIDFGIAKAASSVQEPTMVGTIKGKIAYLSPEQINGKPIDGRSDVFALGIVAWELLTLQRPFSKQGDSEVTIIGSIDHCDERIVAPSKHNPAIPTEVDEVILKALRRDPNERYATASEFQSTLRQVLVKYFPNYSYSETGRFVRSMFDEEITRERKELRELNHQAQNALTNVRGDDTTMISRPGMVTGMMKGIRSVVPGIDNVDVRLLNIESMMKQRATARHYMMFAFYVISLVALKMDDKYSLFNLFFPVQAQPQISTVAKELTKESKARAPATKNSSKRLSPKKVSSNVPNARRR